MTDTGITQLIDITATYIPTLGNGGVQAPATRLSKSLNLLAVVSASEITPKQSQHHHEPRKALNSGILFWDELRIRGSTFCIVAVAPNSRAQGGARGSSSTS